ncbi:protein LIFEGUARD 2 [Sesamum angolense]|uniref:Protein LIFEGUARD 2 n=1 Tax=Sesamum angolense TaxID=2727404 RepID=A0AAE1X968_9LAMI|nr:protein LIFEGUARD 2 [Sesamum angolense]
MSDPKNDVEAGSGLLYPLMQESPELRWAFIRKVYSILTVQLLVTIAFAALVVAVHPVATFFAATRMGRAVYVVIVLIPIIVLCPLYCCKNKHPLNFVLLGIFTLCYGLAFGVVCAFFSGKVVIETVIATTVVVISLTLYTFWAAKRGQDFGFLAPFLLSILVILLMFTIFQIFFPMGKISETIYSGLTVIIFCAYIIYDTDNLIKRNSYNDYIWASVALYLDIHNIFFQLLKIFGASEH